MAKVRVVLKILLARWAAMFVIWHWEHVRKENKKLKADLEIASKQYMRFRERIAQDRDLFLAIYHNNDDHPTTVSHHADTGYRRCVAIVGMKVPSE